MYATAVCLFPSFNSEIKSVRLSSYSRHHVLVVTMEHLQILPWLPIEGWALTPEETNQDTVPYLEVAQYPYQDLGSGETCGSLIHKPTLDFPMLETDAPQTCGKLEAWCHPNNPKMCSIVYHWTMMNEENLRRLNIFPTSLPSTPTFQELFCRWSLHPEDYPSYQSSWCFKL